MLWQRRHPLETTLGVRFRDRSLLQLALTHRSFIHERPNESSESNERLEFLGDAFLGHVIAEELYRLFPAESEGHLTEMRSRLVRTEALARLAAEFSLGDHLLLGRGEERSGGRTKERNLARTLEAVLGALLLDRGFTEARKATVALFQKLLDSLPPKAAKDYKSTLQEEVQARGAPAPAYDTVAEEDGPHDRRFTVQVRVQGEVLATGAGPSKRKAEQEAAKAAYETLVGSTAGGGD